MLTGENQSTSLFISAFVLLSLYLLHTARRLNLVSTNASFTTAYLGASAIWTATGAWIAEITMAVSSRGTVRVGQVVKDGHTVLVYDQQGRLLFSSFAGGGADDGMTWWTPRHVGIVSRQFTRLYDAGGRIVSCTAGISVRPGGRILTAS